jgi:Tfp pilus assembly protein PilV
VVEQERYLVRNRSQPDGDGFTMVEVAVALTVLALGVVAVIGVMGSAFNVAVSNGARSRAVSLATKELETIRAVPYASITAGAATTSRDEVSGGRTYHIEQAVTWVSQGTNALAYKQGTVDVSWTDHAGRHDVHQTTYYYPGGLGPAVTPTTTPLCGGAPSAPASLAATAVVLPDSGGVDLAWTKASGSQPVLLWMVQSSTNNFLTSQIITNTQPGTATSLQVEALAASTSYQFRVAAIGMCLTVSPWSPVATVATSAAAALACQMGTPNVTPAKIKLSSNSANAGLSATPTITVSTTGTCTSVKASYKKKATSAATTATLIASSGGSWSASLSTTGPWDVGVHSVDIFDSANVKQGTVLLTVCSKNAPSC